MMSVLSASCKCDVKCFCSGLRAHVFSRVLNPSDETVFEKTPWAWPGLQGKVAQALSVPSLKLY